MKLCYFAFLFLSFTYYVHLQETGSGDVISIDRVNVAPSWANCEAEDLECTMRSVQQELLGKFESGLLGTSQEEKVALMNIKFIIDTTGNVAWARAVGPTRELEAEGVRVVRSFPTFTPGKHEGKNVNVLVDFPLQINFSENPAAEKVADSGFEKVDIPPLLKNCKKSEDPRKCTALAVNNFSNQNIRTSGLPVGRHETVVRFVVDTEGKVQNVKAEGESHQFNLRAIEMARKLPRFIPGSSNGEFVSVSYSLPIKLQIF